MFHCKNKSNCVLYSLIYKVERLFYGNINSKLVLICNMHTIKSDSTFKKQTNKSHYWKDNSQIYGRAYCFPSLKDF